MNRLAKESSPYLQQHAENPIDWYPWGEEAFAAAKEQNKPIFLSIGYSTCHWCHRMAEDCFEDEEVAALLNQDFISIKVDREERPDIDQIYMNVCQMLTGAGGWPLSIFMTADQLPFHAGMYFPKYSQGKQPGMLDTLNYMTKVFKEQPDRILQIGEGIRNGLVAQNTLPQVERNESIVHAAQHTLAQHFDGIYGGFGQAPKFPNIPQLSFLLRYYAAHDDEQSLYLVEKTVTQIYRGGIYDHIGGGICRYSTDQQWKVPHFEKMLYDQAQFLMILAELYQITKKPLYKNIMLQIIRFLDEEMLGQPGMYYSAIDADSDGVEGDYYLWPLDAVEESCRQDFGLTEGPHLEGKYVIHLIENEQFEQFMNQYEKEIQALKTIRDSRPALHKDEKCITSWNALCITAFCKVGAALEDESLIAKAEELMKQMLQQSIANGKIMMTDAQKEEAFLDDYSLVIQALNELYLATQKEYYLQQSIDWSNYVIEHFTSESGGFSFVSDQHEKLIINPKPVLDGVMPTGNSVLAVEFFKLARLSENFYFEKIANQQLAVFSKDSMTYPSSTLTLLQLDLMLKADYNDFKMAGQSDEVIRKLGSQFRPFDTWKTTVAPTFSFQQCKKDHCSTLRFSTDEVLDML
ncbi:thioredoxin domain-containing protein [Kurthia zopfii]|uniref:thioredoxin domain-containing protein n=1 Tax=Kurthia zopfii TaxID=1650 RepID=UPI000F6E6DBA|nr:thioredoxin domain-containing protein [Kurthia zopfii]VEI07400.1 Thioredoxin-related protein [Kurthia zopfii]